MAIENTAMFSLSYGLFVLTAREGNKNNGCIINTAIQLTDTPLQVAIAVNKQNLTHDMILNTGLFNLSVLTEEAPFKVFQHFGFQSGRDVDKFADCEEELRSENGLLYLPKFINAFISGKVVNTVDCSTHTLFIAEVTEAKNLSKAPSATYSYYFANIKPKPVQKPVKGYVCKICGYVHEDDELPDDFICPLCKHGASDFEPAFAEENAEKKVKYVCKICGYVYEGDELSEDFVCPLCKHGAADFEKVEI